MIEINKIDRIEKITFRGKNKIAFVDGMMIDEIKKYRVISTQPTYFVLKEYYENKHIIITREDIVDNMDRILDVQYW
jgi:hypothetical protein